MQPIVDHIQITVKDLIKAESFYDQLMPILGFDLAKKSKGRVDAHEFDVIEYAHQNFIFAINSPRSQFKNDVIHRRKPGSIHHLAFKAQSEEQVNNVYEKLLLTEATIVSEPQFFPQHGKHYYAVFFKDLDGIKYEVVFDKR